MQTVIFGPTDVILWGVPVLIAAVLSFLFWHDARLTRPSKAVGILFIFAVSLVLWFMYMGALVWPRWW